MRPYSIVLWTGLLAVGLTCESRAQAPEETAEVLLRLQSDVPQVRAAAALEMADRGLGSEVALQGLGKLLADPDQRVRRAAMTALRRLNPDPQFALPALTKLLADPDPAVAAQAAGVLSTFGPEVLPYMSKALAQEDARYWAALVLAGLGPEAAPAVPELLAALNAEEPEVRREVVMTLGEIGPEAKAAVPALLELLGSNDKAMVLSATYALGKMGSSAQLASTALRTQLNSDDLAVQVGTAWALAQLNPEDRSVQQQMVGMLVQVLGNMDNADARVAAARALVDLRPAHDVLLPELKVLMEDASPEVVSDAVRALAAVGEPAVPGLVRMLQYEAVRPIVARSLARLGPQAAVAVQPLAEYLPKSQPSTQREILFALGNIGEAAQPAVPAIAQQLSSEDPEVRYSAVYALGKLGPVAQAAAPQLRANLNSDDSFYRVTSAWALVRVDPQGADVARLTVPVLIAALEHDRSFVRVEAADALGRLGGAARPALPALRKAMGEDENEMVRNTARAAVEKIGA